MSRYIEVMDTVPGWFYELDARLFAAIDLLQRHRGVTGDLLEIGVYEGKSAILMGHLARPEERLVACDVFSDSTEVGAENEAESRTYYKELRQEKFEREYLRFHPILPVILAVPSTKIDRTAGAGSFRFVHIDGSHVYDVVREDIATARSLLGAGGVVVFDDWTQPHTPGVALAVWEEYLRGELLPLCVTNLKMYATWDSTGLTAADLDSWAATQPDIEVSNPYHLAGRELRRYTVAPPHAPRLFRRLFLSGRRHR